MTYKFPVIKHLNDVYDAIDIKCFYLVQKDGYQIINYMFSSPEAFPPIEVGHFGPQQDKDIIKREFRGLKFDLEGNIICRPWHKFFNVGERAETALENIDVSRPHIILEKLDGSMIAPFIVNGKIVWGTKMGHTEVSEQVEKWLMVNLEDSINYISFVTNMIETNYTPIFEWTSNAQRIVLDYPESKLVLTGIRNMHTGEYASYDKLQAVGLHWNIPVVKAFYAVPVGGNLTQGFIDYIKSLNDMEGVVVKFDDGHMYKMKSDWYCQLHRVKSEINYERGVVSLLINGNMDDLKSLMPANDRQRIEDYEVAFNTQITKRAMWLQEMIFNIHDNGMTRKDYALTLMPTREKWESNIVFKTWEEYDNISIANIYGRIEDFIVSNCNRNSKFEEMRTGTSLFKDVPEWKPVMFDTEEG